MRSIVGLKVGYGYRVGEVLVKGRAAVKPEYQVTKWFVKDKSRMVIQRNICTPTLAPPFPDIYHVPTVESGVAERVGAAVQEPDNYHQRRLRSCSRNVNTTYLRPLRPDEIPDLEECLEHSTYNETQKEQIRQAAIRWRDAPDKRKFLACLCFCKSESSLKNHTFDPSPNIIENVYKSARGIYSRTNEFKSFFMPYAHAMEKMCYENLPFVVKKVPLDLRPAYMKKVMNEHAPLFFCTDHTGFEGRITPTIMHCIEFQFYKYMLSQLPEYEVIIKFITRALGGVQKCYFKDWMCETVARMSGEMTTSLGNAVTNYVCMCCVAADCGWDSVRGVVEGDDGVFEVRGRIPTVADFAAYGFVIKIELHPNLNESTFCQLVFDNAGNLVPSPRKVLVNTCWTDGKYKCTKSKQILLGLLRAKVLSLRALAPKGPVVWAFGKRLDEATGGVQPVYEDRRYAPEFAVRADRFEPPSDDARVLCSRVWGIDIQVQLAAEKALIDDWDFEKWPECITEMLNKLSHGLCVDYTSRYVCEYGHTMY